MSVIVRVSEVTSETPDIRTLRLVREDGAPFTPYEAGAHVDVTGPTGVLRQYSLCSPPEDPTSILIAVKKEPASRGGSSALHEVVPGDRLKVGKPRNLLTIAPEATMHVLLAGGIGLTPMLSLAYALWQRGAEFTLHCFARSREDMAFRELLEERAEFVDRVVLHYGLDIDEQGRVLASAATGLPSGAHVYTCGPTPFMAQVSSVFAPVVGEDQVHIEHFVAQEVETRGEGFTVVVDGQAYPVPENRSILSVLEENGIEVFKSCEEGICGSCVSGVLSGTPDHRDHCLSAAEKASNTEMAICVSRSLSDTLEIELY